MLRRNPNFVLNASGAKLVGKPAGTLQQCLEFLSRAAKGRHPGSQNGRVVTLHHAAIEKGFKVPELASASKAFTSQRSIFEGSVLGCINQASVFRSSEGEEQSTKQLIDSN